MGYILLALAIIAFALIISNIYVVQQSRAYVIERLGGFHTVHGVTSKNSAHMIFVR